MSNCESVTLEEINCQEWQCFRYDPNPPKDDSNYVTGFAIAFSLLIFIALIIVVLCKIRKKYRHGFDFNQRGEIPQNDSQIDQITAITNRNYYFSIDASSSSEDFDEDSSARTPIIRPRSHQSII